MVRAVAYVRDIDLGPAGEALGRAGQTRLIQQFAADAAVEIVAWFEDGPSSEEVLKRPGIQSLLAYSEPYDLLLCERVWVLSRSLAALKPFFKELDARGVGFESAASAWDCISQQCRRRFKSLPVLPRAAPVPGEIGRLVRCRIAKPARLNFAHLVHPN